MKDMLDNQFDLAIVDPPYEVINNNKARGFKNDTFKNIRNAKEWDYKPSKEYFKELFRVSKNQIIWGFQYFIYELHPTKSVIVWDKMNGANFMNDAELAWNSGKGNNRIFKHAYIGRYHPDPIKIHPTQKPTKLYEWLLMNYAKEGDTILDTHLGSGSIAIACHNLGYDLTGYEIDKDYYEAAVKRIEQHKAQMRLF
jgi:site-specific DNA-methyltransferase (adenine-specific)